MTVRVLYQPFECYYWTYGWTFESPSLEQARDTIKRVGNHRENFYSVEEVLPNDVDHPKQAREKVQP